jgi:hypothetical protein
MADPLTQAGNIVGDLGELIGFVLLPPLREVMAVFTSGVGPLTDNREGFEQLGESIAGVVRNGLEPLKEGFTTAVAVITTGVETIAFVFRNAADLAELAMLDLSIAATDWIPGLEAGLQNLGAFFFALWETVQVSFGDFVDNVKNGFTEILNAGEALVKAIKAAFDALVTGKNPLEAFGATFIETLANQTGTEGFQTSDLQEVFETARDNALEGFADPGQGLIDNLRRQRDAVADRIGQREFVHSEAQRAQSDPQAVTPPAGAARGEQSRGAAALQAGSREAAAAILRAQIGAANPQKKLEQHTKVSADEAKKQTALMQQFLDVAGAAGNIPVLGFEGGN